MGTAAATALGSNKVNRRLTFVRWVRRTHGWFGLWGALLGLMFGFSGIWLNHRATLKMPLPDQHQAQSTLALPDPRPETIDALGAWLQKALKLDRSANSTRIERARPVPWVERGAGQGGETRPPMQPERWTLNFGGPNKVVQVEYWVGNKSATVRTTDNGFVATLTNLHKGATMPVPWILLIDSLAGSMIFLSISGAILWWETHRRRKAGIAIFGVAVVVTVALAAGPLQF